MRGLVLFLCLVISTLDSVSQSKLSWVDFLATENLSPAELTRQSDYLVELDIDSIRSMYPNVEILRSIDKVHHIIRVPNKSLVKGDLNVWKASPLWKLTHQLKNNSEQFYVITTVFEESLFESFDLINSYTSSNTFLIEGSADEVMELLLPKKEVIHISDRVKSPKIEARVIDMNLNPNRVNRIHHSFPELNGEDQVIAIQENRFDVNDIDLVGRSVLSGLESEISDNHANEMATIISGAGNSFITGRGVANRAEVTSTSFEDAMPSPDDFYDDLGIAVQNHSYGIPRESEYGIQARAFDLNTAGNKNLLHVFSSGNEGLEVSSDGQYAGVEGYANLTGNVKMAKNTLVVGSVDTVGNVPGFVSRGPTYDGRIKPEVVAYSVAGSSNSAALVSGIATLLQQQYELDQNENMPSALAKAIIINSADDVGQKGVDFLTGFGNVNAWKSLSTLQAGNFNSGSVGSNETQTFQLSIPNGAKNLKVTLCWVDPPANVGDFQALINDLDLRLKSNSELYLPWVLDASPSVSALSADAARGVDRINNVEQVTVADPTEDYIIEVEGNSLVSNQEFYLAWQYDLENTFEWDYPTGSDNMPYNGETASYFRWSTTFEGQGVLSYTTDDTDWVELASNLELANRYWRWNNIPEIDSQIKARMAVGSTIFETDYFTVSKPLKTSVGFNCADSVMLRWSPAPNASSYEVSSLGDQFMESFISTVDTFLVIPNISSFSSPFFAIKPKLADGSSLISTPAFDYTLQGIDCYVASFFQTVALDSGIFLSLSLGTTYGIDKIVFERNEFEGYREIAVYDNITKDQIRHLDAQPVQGYNEHRAIVTFINGQELVAEAGSSYFLTEVPYRIFPNPVSAGEPLFIITKEFQNRTPLIEIIDQQGALVHQQLVQGSQDDIPTSELKSGIYFFRLFADENVFTGRIRIR